MTATARESPSGHLLAGDEQYGDDPPGIEAGASPGTPSEVPARRRSRRHPDQTAAVLERRDQRKGDLRALVELGAIGEEAVGEGGVLAGNRRPPEGGSETSRFARHRRAKPRFGEDVA